MIARFAEVALDEQERRVVEHVETHGWNVTNIREEDGLPGWAFTIGLFENYGHPEVILCGLSEKTRHAILNWIGENVKDGKAFAGGEEHDWVLEKHSCWSREVREEWYKEMAGWAVWFYGGTAFPLVQCIWPDKNGAYPWEPEAGFLSVQPLLFESGVISARMSHYVNGERLAAEEWPFTEDPHQRVFVSRCVMEDGAPIVRVVRDAEGDWQFIGPVDDPNEDGGKVCCFHCVIEREPELRKLARLVVGWCAWREEPGGEWQYEVLAD